MATAKKKEKGVSETKTKTEKSSGAFDDLHRQFNSSGEYSKIKKWCSSGSLVVDKVLAGGRQEPCSLIPFGRQVEIAGLPGVGKTSVCAQIAKEVQAMGGYVVLTDTENRLDHNYWPQLGVDMSKVIMLDAEWLEDVFTEQIKLIQSYANDKKETPMLMLWDSVGSIAGRPVDIEDPMSKGAMASDARTTSHGMKIINTMISRHNIAYVYTNHMYTKLNVKFGSPWETGGGQKLKYFATVRLQFSKGEAIKESDVDGDDQVVGHRVYVKALKNSMAPMLIEQEAVLIGGKGFSNDYTVMEKAESRGLIVKAGTWREWVTSKGEAIKFQNWKGFQDKIVSHPDYAELCSAVKSSM